MSAPDPDWLPVTPDDDQPRYRVNVFGRIEPVNDAARNTHTPPPNPTPEPSFTWLGEQPRNRPLDPWDHHDD